jgi:hypothetical protein
VPADPGTLAAIEQVPGVRSATSSATGASIRVAQREVVAAVVAALVRAGTDVFAAVPRPPTLEDVYFEIEARRGMTAPAPPTIEVPAS